MKTPLPVNHKFWLLGLLLAPLLFGSTGLEGKAVVGLLCGFSVCWLAGRYGSPESVRPLTPRGYCWIVLGLLLLPLVPWPAAWHALFNPERLHLAQLFPVDPEPVTFLPLTLSVGRTIERLADYLLIITLFWLARRAAGEPGFPRLLVAALVIAVGLLGASDIWLRLDPLHRALGWRPDPGGHAAGTFANRNHFASWIYMAILFGSGWVARSYWPVNPAPRQESLSAKPLAIGSGLVFACGLFFAIKTGSRGGLLAFLCGLAVLVMLHLQRSRHPRRWWALGLMCLLVGLSLLLAGGYLITRLASFGSDGSFKAAIWKEAFQLANLFPIVGTGPGTFAVAFNHFKAFGGDSTFLHAENDWLQVLVEQGWLGVICLVVGLGYVVLRLARYLGREKLEEPELIFGAVAALVAFGAHAVVEFVWQIQANALLASALLGFVAGSRDRGQRTAVVPPPAPSRVLVNVAWGVAVLVVAGFQGLAFFRASEAGRSRTVAGRVDAMRQSLRCWPWSTSRQLAMTRLEVARWQAAPFLPFEPAIRTRLSQALRDDPFNWELRLERAWLDLNFGTNRAGAIAEAWQVVRLNPRQGQIPIQFARHFQSTDRDLAWAFLEAVPSGEMRLDQLREAMDVAWQLDHDPRLLWSLTPLTRDGLETLGAFARHKKLEGLAAAATRERAKLGR